MKIYIILLFALLNLGCSKEVSEIQIPDLVEPEIYFPPINSDVWETTNTIDLNWNENELQPLLNFLEEKNTKSFIILHNGKIVTENYFNNHNSSSIWYWASAGKTLTATVSGIAQENGFININSKVSDYLGENWTNIPIEKENLITCKNLLSMTSGLDDTLGEDVSHTNLKYISDAGKRWAYHNVYVKMQDVIEKGTNTTFKEYFNTTLKDKIGMSGTWTSLSNLSIYWSNTRSMARFGLLISNKGKWKNTQIVSENFISETTNSSQNINNSYGYLWWLNGKTSYQLPQSQHIFNGELISNAPTDMFCALGKNDQKIYIVPSKKLVIIRMGEAAENSNFALSNFDNELWIKLNLLMNL